MWELLLLGLKDQLSGKASGKAFAVGKIYTNPDAPGTRPGRARDAPGSPESAKKYTFVVF